MKISIIAVGKMRRGAEQELLDDYLKRVPWEVSIKEVEEKKSLPPEKLKEKEAELLLAEVPKGAIIVALDERGKNISSEDFSVRIKKWQEESGNIAFLIGGADGHGKMVKERANFLLSLGNMTWPHMMVRPMLAEQLYRSYTIMKGHPYHRG